MKPGDLVKWTSTLNHDYFNNKVNMGIFLEHVETFDHWILAEVLDAQGKKSMVMLQKKANPL